MLIINFKIIIFRFEKKWDSSEQHGIQVLILILGLNNHEEMT